jgi:hypothetical protein
MFLSAKRVNAEAQAAGLHSAGPKHPGIHVNGKGLRKNANRHSRGSLWSLLAGLAYLCGFRKVGTQGACVGMFTLTVLATIWR